MSSESQESFIKYKSADIYFIFSFVFNLEKSYQELAEHLSQNKGWIEGVPPDRQGKPPMLVIKRIKRKKENEKENKYIATSLFKKLPVDQETKLKFKEDEEISNSSEWQKGLDKFNVEIEAFIRIFDNGAGCITFKLTSPQPVTLRRLHHILSLSQRNYDPDKGMSTLLIEKKDVRLFDVFVSQLENIEKEINSSGKENKKYVEIQDKHIMDFHNKDLVAQNPYVLSVVEVESGEEEPLFWQRISHEAINRYEHEELSAILFRMVYPDRAFRENLKETISSIRIPYELRGSSKDVLKNYAWDSRILMCFSRVSSLFACENKNQSPASFIKNSLLDSLEILRTRWHMSILINALLDQDMAMIQDKASSDNEEALKIIIKRRKQFAHFLDDPLPYNFEGSSVTQIIAEAEEEMWLSKLRTMTASKLELLEKLYQDYEKSIQYQFDEELEKEVKRSLKENIERSKKRKKRPLQSILRFMSSIFRVNRK